MILIISNPRSLNYCQRRIFPSWSEL